MQTMSELQSATSRHPTLIGKGETYKLRENLSKLCGVEHVPPPVTESPLITETDKGQKKVDLLYDKWSDSDSYVATSSTPTATASPTVTPPPSSPTLSTKYSSTHRSQSDISQEPQAQSESVLCKGPPKNSRKRPLRKTQYMSFSEFEVETSKPSISESQVTFSPTLTPPPQSQSVTGPEPQAPSETVLCEEPPTKSRKCPPPKTQFMSTSELEGETSSPSLSESQVDASKSKGRGRGRGRGRGKKGVKINEDWVGSESLPSISARLKQSKRQMDDDGFQVSSKKGPKKSSPTQTNVELDNEFENIADTEFCLGCSKEVSAILKHLSHKKVCQLHYDMDRLL